MKADDESITLEDEEELNLIEKGLSSSNSLSDKTKQVLEETKSRAHSINFETIHAEMKLPKVLFDLLEKNAKDKGIGMAALLGEIMTSYVESDTSSSEEEKKSLIKLIQNNPIELENYVLSEIENKHLSPITHGTEGEIYKLEIENKSYVVVKKRYSSAHKNEFSLLKRAKEIQEKLSLNGNSIKIPTPIGSFVKNDSEYIMMEYIEGKTLYTMSLEKILEKEFIKYYKQISNETVLKDYLYNISLVIEGIDENLLKNFDNYQNNEILKEICEKNGNLKKINLEDDSMAEKVLINFYKILYENKLIHENPEIIDPVKKENPFLVKKYRENIKGIGVFSEMEGIKIGKEINSFLQEMHKEGLYHRDLGGNPRNIMFTKTNTGEYEAYIIDFGKASITAGEDSRVYTDDIAGGIHDRDEDIILQIQNISSNKQIIKLFDETGLEKITYINNLGTGKYKLDKGALLSNLKNLSSGISKGYTISINHILPIFNRHNVQKRNTRDKYLFIEGIDKASTKDEKVNEINKYSDDVKIELIGFLAYMNEVDFEKLGEYLQNLDLSNMGKKAEGYKNFFIDLYNDIKEIR
ncbi:MAG: lipopolysaccharide kinase InaA family protein [Candidatus Gracilibacteria bacterium]|nr:lipopolysaccharide kinase InaA family protein [Candidatus Gracilibacteria bacterium]